MIEKKYEEYASEAVESVFQYFTKLHGAMQKMEHQILLEIRNKVMIPITKARIAHATMSKSLETLEEIRGTLQRIASDPPNILLSTVIEKTNSNLETIACNIEMEEPEENPFIFEEVKNTVKEIESCCHLQINKLSFKSKVLSFYGDSNSTCDQSSLDEKFHNLSIDLNRDKKKVDIDEEIDISDMPTIMNTTIDITSPSDFHHPKFLTTTSGVNSQKVHVSHIKSPDHFYVQNQIFLSVANEFKDYCMQEAKYAATPDYIENDDIYLVLNPTDKNWYRGKVMETICADMCKVFLVDYGDSLDVPKQRVREISDDLRLRPYGAIECSLYGLKPKGNKWTDEANHLMSEIIANKVVIMIVLKDNDPISLVDLIATHTKYSISIRDALIYANVAEDNPLSKEIILERISALENVKRSLIHTVKTRFFKNVFKDGENFRVLITNIINPQEFHLMKYDHKDDLKQLEAEINLDYEKSHEKLFCPQPLMPCAAFVNGKWNRAKFISQLEDGNCKIWLIDHGRSEIVNWKQIREIDDKFLVHNEMSFQCSLVDIEPLQEHDYFWSEEAIAEFKRIAKNPVLQIFVHRSKEFRYKVVLYVIKKNVDINVNALLVKYNHAIATGTEATCVELPKNYSKNSPKIEKEMKSSIAETTAKVKSSSPLPKKTKVKISHIVSPGEFYVHITDHINGIITLHREIQMSQSKKELCVDIDKDWIVGENCFVFTALKKDGTLQWYRGVITEVNPLDSGSTYTVFLCDHGNKLSNISRKQLTVIDSTFSRVCNGAVPCHLACVQPTGGLDSWSYSSIDEFTNLIGKYEAFTAAIQGKRQGKSIPIILWGMTTEFSDPLSPHICKWMNLNKVLVNCGLAHLTEKFDPTQQLEDIFQNELLQGQETLEQWIDHFNNEIDTAPPPEEYNVFDADRTEELEIIDEIIDGEIDSWPAPRPIGKTVFTAYPTYVDNNAIIYLHDAVHHEFLSRMKELINKHMTNTEAEENFYWYTGQPCLARYHADNKFYRAIIQETKPGQVISVQFVDYGNIEDCTTNDLRRQIMLDKIPIQANKYRLDGVIPANGEISWPIKTLDYIHANIVGKLCTVRVSPDQEKEKIKKCSIRFETYDLAELLLNSDFATTMSKVVYVEGDYNNGSSSNNSGNEKPKEIVQKEKRKKTKHDKKRSKCESQLKTDSTKSEEEIIIPNEDIENDIMDSDEYQKMFEKIELGNLYKSIAIASDEENSDEDIVELEFTYQMGYWQNKENDVGLELKDIEKDDLMTVSDGSSVSSFNPKETSSVKSHFAGIDKFAISAIPHGVVKFYCEIAFIRNSTHLYITPFLTEHQQRFTEMSRRIQHIAKTSQPFAHSQISPNIPCLALYTVDNMWYRAIIRSYSPETERLDVLFVDFLNAEMVTAKMIRKIPKHLLEIPLRNLQVKLNSVKPNSRWREIDIQRKLSEALNGHKKVFVKVIKSGRIPEVELYEGQTGNNLVYERMIAERFYLKND